MRRFVLIPLLGILLTGVATTAVSAADTVQTPQAQSAATVQLTKDIALAIQALKLKTGAYPQTATLPVVLNDVKLEMATNITGLPDGFSFKSVPTEASKAQSPIANLSADIAANGDKQLTVESLYATTFNKGDVVGFSTSGTEFAVTYTIDNKNFASTESTLVNSPSTPAPNLHPKTEAPEYHLAAATTPSTSTADTASPGTETTLSSDDVMLTLENIRKHNDVLCAPTFTNAQTVNIVSVSPEAP